MGVVAALLEEGANIVPSNAQVARARASTLRIERRHCTMLQGRTPLHYAVYMGRVDIASELLRR